VEKRKEELISTLVYRILKKPPKILILFLSISDRFEDGIFTVIIFCIKSRRICSTMSIPWDFRI